MKRKLLDETWQAYGSCVVTLPKTERFRKLNRTQTKNLNSQ